MAQIPTLPRSTPEAQGIDSSAILALIDDVERAELGLHSIMVLRHGAVVAEGWWAPYTPERPHMLFSLSKSFTSTAVGLAVAEGRLTVDDRVLSFFPEETPAEVSEHLAAMRVRDLLTMSTGHETDSTPGMRERADGDWARAFLEWPVLRPPGTHFVYNSGATYMLSAIVQRLTGQTLLEYLRPRLLGPLGIDDAAWESCPRGVNVGGWGLSITTESIARFGQLYLQRGVWRGQRLIPAEWVAAASSAQVPNGSDPASDWAQGYGYQFWRCRHNIYRGDGAFGQYCVVMPEQDAVVAITSGTADMQAVLNLLWKRLLPAMGADPLPPGASAQQLQEKLRQLALPPARSASAPPAASPDHRWAGDFPPNDAQIEHIALIPGDGSDTLVIRKNGREHAIVCGRGAWVAGETALETETPAPVAASGGWVAPGTYEARLCYTATPFCATVTCTFAGGRVTLGWRMNVWFGPTELPTLEGRAA